MEIKIERHGGQTVGWKVTIPDAMIVETVNRVMESLKPIASAADFAKEMAEGEFASHDYDGMIPDDPPGEGEDKDIALAMREPLAFDELCRIHDVEGWACAAVHLSYFPEVLQEAIILREGGDKYGAAQALRKGWPALGLADAGTYVDIHLPRERKPLFDAHSEKELRSIQLISDMRAYGMGLIRARQEGNEYNEQSAAVAARIVQELSGWLAGERL